MDPELAAWIDARLKALAALIARSLERIEARVERIEARVEALTETMNARSEQAAARLDDLERRMGALQRRLETLERHMGATERHVDAAIDRLGDDLAELAGCFPRRRSGRPLLRVLPDGLSEDMRQRFHLANERLALLA